MQKKKIIKKAKIYFILFLIFTLLTFAGAIYVISNKGEVNVGYACVPMTFGIIFGGMFNKARSKKERNSNLSLRLNF